MLTLAVDVVGMSVTVVGGGPVAERKVCMLVEAGARVRVISPEVTAGLRNLWGQGTIRVNLRGFMAGDTADATLVVAATGSGAVDAAVAAEARGRGALVSVSGQAAQGNLHFTAQVRRGPIRIGISTGGAAPVLAKMVAKRVEQAVGPEYGLLADLLAAAREQVKALPGLTQPQRAQVLQTIAAGPALGLFARGDVAGAQAVMAQVLQRVQPRARD